MILREQRCSFGLKDESLFWQSISRVFFSRFMFCFFSYKKSLFISNSIIFDLKFSLDIYWELITNFEFNLFFHLIRNFHVSFFFFFLTLLRDFLHLMLPCGLDTCHFYVSHGNSKIWHVAWFHLLIVYCWQVIKCKLIWSQTFNHDQSSDYKYIIKFWCL